MNGEEILKVYVKITESIKVEGNRGSVNMIQFTGEAKGPYFNGEIRSGAVDWQRIDEQQKVLLSARYILEGTDTEGNSCYLAIENNGTSDEKGVVRTKPCIVTNSKALAWMEHTEFGGNIGTEGDLVVIRILRY